MRYGEFDGPTDPHPPLDERKTFPRTVDRIREAAHTDRYWALVPESGDVWTLREFNDTTGQLGAPVHRAGPLTSHEAAKWADDTLGILDWDGLPGHPNAWIDAAYHLVRDIGRSPRRGRSIVLRIEPDQHTPGLMLVIVRERWDATGLESSPLTTYERTAFRDTAHVLQWASKRFGLDPAGWVTVTEDAQYHHL